MSETAVLKPEQKKLLSEAAEWRLLALLLECPSPGWHQQVSALENEVADPELQQAARAAQQEASEGLYHSCFGPGGPVSPREVSFHEVVQLGYLMSELEAYYRAFSYQPDISEPSDHVAVEAGFIGYLRLKEAYAIANDDAEHAAITAEAAERFLQEHLAYLAEPLASALTHSDVQYLTLAAKCLRRRTGPPKSLRVLPPDVACPSLSEASFECGEQE
jgi:nitrate reductase assembly molybdenum cofactor insertion protein NarJ